MKIEWFLLCCLFLLVVCVVLVIGLVLVGFFGIIGVILFQVKYQIVFSGLCDWLENDVLVYFVLIDVGCNGCLLLLYFLFDLSFLWFGFGLYVVVEGEYGFYWELFLVIGCDFSFLVKLLLGEMCFVGLIDICMGWLYYYSYGVVFELQDDKQVLIIFMVVQIEDQFQGENVIYWCLLIIYLFMLGVMLIVLQMLLLCWSFILLCKVVVDMSWVECGKSDLFDSQYLLEFIGFIECINGFIESECEQCMCYCNMLVDFVYSLKMLLVVMCLWLEFFSEVLILVYDVFDQVCCMDELVVYQFVCVVIIGCQLFVIVIFIGGYVEDLVQSLEKVYVVKNVLCEFEIDEGVVFYGEQGDLFELMGNLLENVFKWLCYCVLLVIKVLLQVGKQCLGLLMSVEDDGLGIEFDQVDWVFQCGVCGDECVQGYGIGLFIVQDIVWVYQGELVVDCLVEFGGVCFSVILLLG